MEYSNRLTHGNGTSEKVVAAPFWSALIDFLYLPSIMAIVGRDCGFKISMSQKIGMQNRPRETAYELVNHIESFSTNTSVIIYNQNESFISRFMRALNN